MAEEPFCMKRDSSTWQVTNLPQDLDNIKNQVTLDTTKLQDMFQDLKQLETDK